MFTESSVKRIVPLRPGPIIGTPEGRSRSGCDYTVGLQYLAGGPAPCGCKCIRSVLIGVLEAGVDYERRLAVCVVSVLASPAVYVVEFEVATNGGRYSRIFTRGVIVGVFSSFGEGR